MKILFVASEVVPFAKTGGLADVAGALPKALAQLGHEVRIILPRYRAADIRTFKLKKAVARCAVPVGTTTVDVAVFEATLPNTSITTYFLDHPPWFDRDGLYQDHGADFPDNLERFSGFSQAVLHVIPKLGWRPEVVHCHDWQTALVCAHLALTQATDRGSTPLTTTLSKRPSTSLGTVLSKAAGRVEGRSESKGRFWQSVATVLTVHNLAYQGLFPKDAWPLTNLPAHAFGIEGLEFYGQINCLKGGLVYADGLTTVSPTYAKEIQSPEFGCGLEGVLASRREDLAGILNGIDPEEWNPRSDAHLPARYGPAELAGKSLCKLSLQHQQKLPERHVLLIGMIQRLAEQKGMDLFAQAAEELLKLPLQIVILGTGEPKYHDAVTDVARRYPDRLSVNLRFDNALAHQIEAGCDAFLMPSRFEPCGLNQMYSMRYGTVPIVRRVGGLADTVVDVSPATLEAGSATGFVFEEYSADALLHAVKRAVAAFRDHELWERLIRIGMQQDFSWNRSAREYVQVYERALAKRARVQGPGFKVQGPLQPRASSLEP